MNILHIFIIIFPKRYYFSVSYTEFHVIVHSNQIHSGILIVYIIVINNKKTGYYHIKFNFWKLPTKKNYWPPSHDSS